MMASVTVSCRLVWDPWGNRQTKSALPSTMAPSFALVRWPAGITNDIG